MLILRPSDWSRPVEIRFDQTDILGNPCTLLALEDGTTLVFTHIRQVTLAHAGQGVPIESPYYDMGHLCADRDLNSYRRTLGQKTRFDSEGMTREQFIQTIENYITANRLKPKGP